MVQYIITHGHTRAGAQVLDFEHLTDDFTYVSSNASLTIITLYSSWIRHTVKQTIYYCAAPDIRFDLNLIAKLHVTVYTLEVIALHIYAKKMERN